MSDNNTPIESRTAEEIHHLLDFMADKDEYDEDYAKMFNHLTKVLELRHKENESKISNEIKLQELHQKQHDTQLDREIRLEELDLKKTITKETWLNVGTHIAGLIVLMNHERAHVIASKAFGFVKKIF